MNAGAASLLQSGVPGTAPAAAWTDSPVPPLHVCIRHASSPVPGTAFPQGRKDPGPAAGAVPCHSVRRWTDGGQGWTLPSLSLDTSRSDSRAPARPGRLASSLLYPTVHTLIPPKGETRMSRDEQRIGRLRAQVRQLEDLLRGWRDRHEGEGLTGADCHRLQQVTGHLYRLAESPPAGSEHPAATSPACMLVGDGAAMSHLRSLIERIAPRESNVLILGDSGTGKELVARAIHSSGPRRHGRFVAMDCGALSDSLLESELFGHRRGAFTGASMDRVGLLEEAHDGTLFLDELANASAAFQTRLLRVLQEGEIRRVGENRTRAVDLRVIAATSGDLPSLVRHLAPYRPR